MFIVFPGAAGIYVILWLRAHWLPEYAAFEASFFYPGRQQVGSVGDMLILTAGIPPICLSGLRSRHATFPPRLLLREKAVSDQYLGKYNIHIYCVIYDRVKFHSVLQVIWNVFALACPLTALS